jgi:hypothetical protein
LRGADVVAVRDLDREVEAAVEGPVEIAQQFGEPVLLAERRHQQEHLCAGPE